MGKIRIVKVEFVKGEFVNNNHYIIKVRKNMIKIIVIFIISMFLLNSPVYAFTPTNKFFRGVENIITSPVEVVKQTRWAWIEGSARTFHISAWLLCGVVKGAAYTIGRIGSGVIDIVTFPISSNSLMTPASVFQEWPQRTPGIVYKQLGEK